VTTNRFIQRAEGKIRAKRIIPIAALLLLAPMVVADAQHAGPDLAVGGAFVLGAAVLSPLDQRVHDLMAQPSLQSNVALHRTAGTINALAIPGTAIFALGAYAGGQLGHDRGLAEIGFHGGESIILGEVVTLALKGVIGRARPNESPTNPYDFHPGAGFAHDSRGSLPSAHSTAAFALAASASVESARWWRGSSWIGPVAYAGAGTMALARVVSNKHWLSDVLAGAGIGMVSGLLVSHFSASHPRNALDRAFLP
jgi:membrane-associated phospholipid phosphatase